MLGVSLVVRLAVSGPNKRCLDRRRENVCASRGGKNVIPQPEPIDPGKYNFPTLMNDIEHGRVRLPPFQRDFVWSATKVTDLMDSIYKGFPIGSFFYWKAEREYVTLFRDIESLSLPSPALDQELFFILDGQQRLTSIWATFEGSTINGENYARICLNLDAAAKYEEATLRHVDKSAFSKKKPSLTT